MSWNVFIVNVVYEDNSPVENAKVVYNFNQQTQYYTGYTGADGLLKIIAEGAQTAYTASTIFAFDLDLYLESRENHITIQDGYTYTFTLDSSDVGLTYQASVALIDYLYYAITTTNYPIIYQYNLYYKDNQDNYVFQTAGTLNHETLDFFNHRLPTTSIKVELINDEYSDSPYVRYFDYADKPGGVHVIWRVMKTIYKINFIDINDTINWAEFGRSLIGCNVTFLGYDTNDNLNFSSSTISSQPTLIDIDILNFYSVYPADINTMYNLKKPGKNLFKITKNHYNDYTANCFVSANTDMEFFLIESGKTINDPVILEREPNVCMVNQDLYDYVISLTSFRPYFNAVYESERVGVSDMWFTYLWSDSIKRYLPPEYQSMYPNTIENFKTLFVNQLSTTTVSTLYTYPNEIENNYTLDKHHGYVWDRCFIPEENEIIENCLTFSVINNVCNVAFNYVSGTRALFDFDYSLDSGSTWNSYSFNQNGIGQTITLSPGGNKSVKFRRALSNTGTTLSTDGDVFYYFSISGTCTAAGCVNSLLDGYGFDTTEIISNYCFTKLFSNCTGLLTAPELPSTTLADYCYENMFYNCTSLETAPELPATALTSYCYSNMFHGCTSLITPPELPATTLAPGCYQSMFTGCESLTAAPNLPATALAPYCYSGMFNACINITSMPSLLADSLTEGCYQRMFQGCTSLTGVTNLSAQILAVKCYESMFENCSSLQTPPQLNSSSGLRDECCKKMFKNCTSLETIPTNSIQSWQSLGVSCFEEMFRGCSSLQLLPPILPALAAKDYCYKGMFSYCNNLNVRSTGFSILANNLQNVSGACESMFEGCISMTSGITANSVKIGPDSYKRMFYGCYNMSYIRQKFSATTSGVFNSTNADEFTKNWVYNVSSTGGFITVNQTWFNSYAFYGPNGIPNNTGWRIGT